MKVKVQLKYDQLTALLAMVVAAHNELDPDGVDEIVDKFNLRKLRLELYKKRENQLGKNTKAAFTVNIEANQFLSFRRQCLTRVRMDDYCGTIVHMVILEGLQQILSKKQQLINS